MCENAWFKVSYDEKVYYNSIPVSCGQKLYVDSTIDVTEEEIEYCIHAHQLIYFKSISEIGRLRDV